MTKAPVESLSGSRQDATINTIAPDALNVKTSVAKKTTSSAACKGAQWSGVRQSCQKPESTGKPAPPLAGGTHTVKKCKHCDDILTDRRRSVCQHCSTIVTGYKRLRMALPPAESTAGRAAAPTMHYEGMPTGEECRQCERTDGWTCEGCNAKLCRRCRNIMLAGRVCGRQVYMPVCTKCDSTFLCNKCEGGMEVLFCPLCADGASVCRICCEGHGGAEFASLFGT